VKLAAALRTEQDAAGRIPEDATTEASTDREEHAA
jgi:hypothetical protein